MNGRVAKKHDGGKKREARKDPRAAHLMGVVTDIGSNGSKGKGYGKSEHRCCCDCGEEGHIGVNCPHKSTDSADEEYDQGSSWERELEGEKPE